MKKGRYWIAGWLSFVLLTLVWVVGRQTSSMILAQLSTGLKAERAALETSRAEELARIRESMSRAVVVPRAEAMGMRFPADSEIVMLEMPESPR